MNGATLLFVLTVALAPAGLHAQLVVDGATRNFTTSTNLLPGNLTVGGALGNTRLNIIAPGAVTNNGGVIGSDATSSGNLVSVSGSNSVWHNTGRLDLGLFGAYNRLLVTNGGQVVTLLGGDIGNKPGSINNQALVAGAGSTWISSGPINIGYGGLSNSLLVTNGGVVQTTIAILGTQTGSSNNLLLLDDGTLTATDAAGAGLFDVRRGHVLFNSGGITADRLLLTNGAAGVFTFNGGTLVTRGATINNGQHFVVGENAGYPPAVWVPLSNSTPATIGNNLYVGSNAPNASLWITNGAAVVNPIGFVGGFSSSNSAVVSGPSSRWTNTLGLVVGFIGGGNSMLISNSGVVANGSGDIGYASDSNSVVVTGSNSLWTSRTPLHVGNYGSGNSLLIANGGVVSASSIAYVGVNSLSSNNLLRLDNGTFLATNGGTCDLEVGGGTVLLNSGNITADRLLIPNGAASVFTFNGGTLITRGAAVSNAQDFVVGMNPGYPPATWVALSNSTPHTLATNLIIGGGASGASLFITNGGTVANRNGYVGSTASSSSNIALLAGRNSFWTNSFALVVGNDCNANRLVISNGAAVFDVVGSIGEGLSGNNNTALVTGAGSSWTNGYQLDVGNFGGNNQLTVSAAAIVQAGNLSLGRSGTNNQLLVSNGGVLVSGNANLGSGSGASNNRVTVNGANSVWNNLSLMLVGDGGSATSVLVTNGGTVFSPITQVGSSSGAPDNLLRLDQGTLIATNAGGTGMLNVAGGTVLFNAGNITTDRLLLTNAASGVFTFNGGTLTTGDATINNGAALTIGENLGAPAPASWIVRSNASVRVGGGYPIFVGFNAGKASLLAAGGARIQSDTGIVGQYATSTDNLVILANSGTSWTNADLMYIGILGGGNRFFVTNGAVASGRLWVIGLVPGGDNNQVVVSGAGSVLSATGDLNLGLGASGNQLTVTSAGAVVCSNLFLGVNAGSSNNLLRVAGGTLNVAAGLVLTDGAVQCDSGNITTDELVLTNGVSSRFTFNGGTLSMRYSDVNNGSPFIVGNGGSPATCNVGGYCNFPQGLVITNNARLTGSNTVTGTVTVRSGGILSPGAAGASIRRMILYHPPVLQGSVFMEISKTGATRTNDQISLVQTLSYGGSLTVSNLGPDALVPGDSFRLFEAPSYSGAFTSVTLPPLPPGLTWINKLQVDGSIAVAVASFTVDSISGPPGLSYGSVGWGDFDNDNRLDLLITGETNGVRIAQVWRNTGSGFTNVPVAGLPGVSGSAVAWGDFDNDGQLDILLTGYGVSNPICQVWRNTGTGFTNFPVAGLPNVAQGAAVWADFDNDGRLDFLISGTDTTNHLTQLWRNLGGSFSNVTASIAPGLPQVFGSAAAWGDYDGDGRLDLLLMGADPSFVPVTQLWRNTGSGFINVPIPGLAGMSSGFVVWGDYDNDGRLDFLISGGDQSNAPNTQLWRNTGTGFTNATAAAAPGLMGLYDSVGAWGDYDNDGRLDFLISGTTGTNFVAQVWHNSGSGFARDDTVNLPDVIFGSVAWGDYSSDGKLDFLLAGSDGTNFLTQFWKNSTAYVNARPSIPTGLAMTATTNAVMLSWNAAFDAETPSAGLSYNVRAGTSPGGINLFAGHVNANNGFRRVPAMGNAMLRRTLPLTGLTNGQTVYWSVQAVDTAFAGGPFATEISVVSIPQLSITRSNATTAIVSWSPPTWGWRLLESETIAPIIWPLAPTGEQNPVVVPANAGTKFYRLRNY